MTADPHTEFLRLHMAHQKTVFGYLLAAVHDFQTAEDLLQQVTLVLWKKFAEYRRETPFASWALGVARFELLHHFRDHRKGEKALPLDVLDSVAPAIEAEAPQLESESRVLAECIEKLPAPLRSLVKLRYETGESLKALADRLGQSVAAVNMKLVRARRALLDCAQQALGKA